MRITNGACNLRSMLSANNCLWANVRCRCLRAVLNVMVSLFILLVVQLGVSGGVNLSNRL